MTEDDPFTSECEANARGIMQCLRMLAEEAALLHLSRTLAALREAIDVCAAENVLDASADGPEQDRLAVSGRRLLLH
jgi:uncharacterized protein with ATP-grasp and redox domains